jgi:hypothetical protein
VGQIYVVREITEFYYRKGRKGLHMWDLPGRMEVPGDKKEENFYFGAFLYHP